MLNEKIGRLKVISEAEPYLSPKKGTRHKMYVCLCDCGQIKNIRKSSLMRGDTQSCGCLAKELMAEKARTHGGSGHPLFSRWYDMIRRCEDSSRKDFRHYGGRGVRVCEQWSDKTSGFNSFVEDMGESFVQGLEIDRIDVNGDYSKENCRWATRKEQTNNKRSKSEGGVAIYLTYDNITMPLSGWADKVGLSLKCLHDRLYKLGWSLEKALTTPLRTKTSQSDDKQEATSG